MSTPNTEVKRRIITGSVALFGTAVNRTKAAAKVVGEKLKMAKCFVIGDEENPGQVKEFVIKAPFQLVATKANVAGEKDTYLLGQSIGWKAVTVPVRDSEGIEQMTQGGQVAQTRLYLDLKGDGQFTHKVNYMVNIMAVPLTSEDLERISKNQTEVEVEPQGTAAE